MAVDTQRINDFMTYASFLWSGPLQITIALFLLWQQLGLASLAGVGLIVMILPLNFLISNGMSVNMDITMKIKDKKMKLLNEILNAIKVLKMYAWEMSFRDKVFNLRQKEIDFLKKFFAWNGFMVFFANATPFLVRPWLIY